MNGVLAWIKKHSRTICLEVMVLGFFAAVIFWEFQNVFFGQTHFLGAGDTADALYVHFVYLAEQLKQGVIPLWDPHLFGGYPLVAYPLIGIFYPLHWLFWLWPYKNGVFPPEAYTYLISFHFVLAGYAMYVLGRSLKLTRFVSVLMGFVYMLSPNILLATSWSVQINSTPWYPLLLLGMIQFHKTLQAKYISMAILAMGLLTLGAPAHPAIIALFMIGGFAAFSTLWQLVVDRRLSEKVLKLAAGYVGLVALSLMIGSIALLPGAQLSARSIRFLGEDGQIIPGEIMMPHVFARFVMQPKDLLGLFLPTFMGSGMGLYYFGVIPSMLALTSLVWRIKDRFTQTFAVGMVVASTFFSLRLIPLEILYRIPVLNLVREPEKYLNLTTLAMCLLFGLALDHVLRTLLDKDGSAWVKRTLVAAAGMYAVAFSVVFVQRHHPSWLLPLALPVLAIGVFFVWSRFSRTFVINTAVLLALAGLVIVDMRQYVNSEFSFGTFEYRSYFASQEFLKEFVPEQGDFYRISAVESEKFWPYQLNGASIYGAYDTWGYGNPINWRYVEYKGRNAYCDRVYDLLSVRYFITHTESQIRLLATCGNDVRLVSEVEGVHHIDWRQTPYNAQATIQVFENTNVQPYARLLTGVMPSTQAESLRDVTEKVQIETTAVVDDKESYEQIAQFLSQEPKANVPMSTRLNSYEANRITLDVSASRAALLSLGDVYYPGWKAKVDGKPTRVYEINRMFRGVLIPPGEHRVELYFLPDIFVVSGGLFIAAMLCTLGIPFLERTNRFHRLARWSPWIYAFVGGLGMILFLMQYIEAGKFPPILKP